MSEARNSMSCSRKCSHIVSGVMVGEMIRAQVVQCLVLMGPCPYVVVSHRGL